MNKFNILVGVLIIAFIALFVYLEVPVENNRAITEGTIIQYYQTYTDVNGNVVYADGVYTAADSDEAQLTEKKFSEFDEATQKQLLGKKVGDTITYNEVISEADAATTDLTTHPYIYTITIEKIRIDHDEPVENEEVAADEASEEKDEADAEADSNESENVEEGDSEANSSTDKDSNEE